MTEEQWHRTIYATMLMWVIGACIYFVFTMVTWMFGQRALPIVIILAAVLVGRAIGIHTTWLVGEELKPLFIRAPPSVIEAMMREPFCEHQVMVSNQPIVEVPLVTLAVTCIDTEGKDAMQ